MSKKYIAGVAAMLLATVFLGCLADPEGLLGKDDATKGASMQCPGPGGMAGSGLGTHMGGMMEGHGNCNATMNENCGMNDNCQMNENCGNANSNMNCGGGGGGGGGMNHNCGG